VQFGLVINSFGMSWNQLQFWFEPKVGKNRTELDLQTLIGLLYRLVICNVKSTGVSPEYHMQCGHITVIRSLIVLPSWPTVAEVETNIMSCLDALSAIEDDDGPILMFHN
jgi:hypothetical protein